MNKKILWNKTLDALSLSVVNVCDQLQQTNIVPLRSNPDAGLSINCPQYCMYAWQWTDQLNLRGLDLECISCSASFTRQWMISAYFDFISDNVR